MSEPKKENVARNGVVALVACGLLAFFAFSGSPDKAADPDPAGQTTSLHNVEIVRDELRKSSLVAHASISGWHRSLDVRLGSRAASSQTDLLAKTACDLLYDHALGWKVRVQWPDGTVVSECAIGWKPVDQTTTNEGESN